MKNRVCTISLLVLGMLQSPARSQSPGLPFLRSGVGARAQAMGGAYLAQAQDASAVYWNPSALGRLESKELFLYHSRLVSDFTYDYLAYAQSFKRRGSLGLALGRFSKGAFDARDAGGRPLGEFTASTSLLAAAYGIRVSGSMSVGAGIQAIQSKIDSHASHGAAMDISGTWQPNLMSRLAAGIYHIAPAMRFLEESFHLPTTLSLGASRRLFGVFTLNADAGYGLYDRKLGFSLGGELSFAGIASLRTGYLMERGAAGPWAGTALGGGFALFHRARVDYAFVPAGELGSTHHMDLSWRFR